MRSQGLGHFTGTLQHISPIASRQLPHPALAAIYGGPLDIRQESSGTSAQKMEQSFQYVLFAPRFSLDVAVKPKFVQKLHEGQRATLHVRGGRKTLTMLIHDKVSNWFTEKKRIYR